jgi:phytoene dehydrogenase-like protein
MNREERYDFVIVGAGPNGTALAAYLAKSGQSVCLLEERPECGGGCENTEVIPGVRIDPHATYMYAGAAPGFEQLELWKHGLRMNWLFPPEDIEVRTGMGILTTEGRVPMTEKDISGWNKITGVLGETPFRKELVRACYYCPPHPPEVEVTPENIPYMQVYKQYAPDIWTEELLDMTFFELVDEYLETEPCKVMRGLQAWTDGASPEWEGVAIPCLAGVATFDITGASVPKGGMHAYYHSIIRCAIAHGAVVRTCCPVDEIIIREGRAVGVRLRDTAAWGEKTLWANKAVVSGIDIQQTFLKLIGAQHVDVSFIQQIKDISLKGSSLYVTHYLFRAPPRFRPQFAIPGLEDRRYIAGFSNCDSRELYYEHVMDVSGRKGNPSLPPDRVPWVALTHDEDPDRCTLPDRWLISPMYVFVPPPEYHVGGPDALVKEGDAYMLKALSTVVENAEDDLVQMWSNPPWESEFRNVGLIGGGWYATRHCKDQLWTNRPLPGYSRYRSPIDGLYFCHQTSGHPGGLCLMAIPYNLMHILIEDGLVEPGDWWYPSPWYIPEEGKISAIPRK